MAVAELTGRVMASAFQLIAVSTTDDTDLDAALHDAAEHLAHLERCWSRFLPDSDITRINVLSGGGALGVDPSTCALLEAMITGFHATAGAFDPTVIRALIAGGYALSRTDPGMVSSVADGPLLPGVLLDDLVVDHAARIVHVPRGLALDPGGVGKGLAADLTLARLLGQGVGGAMVAVGGDLAAGGVAVDPAGWIVDVEFPDPGDGIACSLALDAGGVATSSVRSRRWTHGGAEHHHQIDPRDGRCSRTDLAAVTVIAGAGWLAEVHATAALAAGSARVVDYLTGHGLSGIAFTADGAVLATDDLAAIEIDAWAVHQ